MTTSAEVAPEAKKRRWASKYYIPKEHNIKDKKERANVKRTCLKCDRSFMTHTKFYRMCDLCRHLNTNQFEP